MGKTARLLGAFGFLFAVQLMIWLPSFEACPLAPSRSIQFIIPLAFTLSLVELGLWSWGVKTSEKESTNSRS